MKIHKFSRLKFPGITIELFHVERDKNHYLLSYKESSGISYGSESKGNKSQISREFNLTVDKYVKGIEGFGKYKIISTKFDPEAKKHFKFFTKPVLGQILDWDKGIKKLGKREEDLEKDFHKILVKQLKEWKGGRNSLMVITHPYWSTFHQMIIDELKEKYDKVILYRGIHSQLAKDILKGENLKVYRFNSWTTDKEIAKDHAIEWSKDGFWVVVKKEYPIDQVVFAPIKLPNYFDPNILTDHFSNEKEFVIEDNKKILNLNQIKVVSKSRKKLLERFNSLYSELVEKY